MDIKAPLIKQPVGLGSLLKKATSAIGIKPCGGCRRRAERLDRAIRLVPRQAWTRPPAVPEGWTQVVIWTGETKQVAMFECEGQRMIWEIIDGEYRNSYSFCGACIQSSARKFEALCR